MDSIQQHSTWLASDRSSPKPNLSDANLRDANLIGANLRDANLRRADLRDANLRRADLSRANLSDANLRDANLRRANLRDANLIGANLIGAYLSDADLSRANLSDANLRDADLIGAYLRDANLRDANLSGANLIGANLIGANLSRANLSGANVPEPITLEKSDQGFIAYRFFNSTNTSYSQPSQWCIKPDTIISETVNHCRTDLCGSGINLGTRAWVLRNPLAYNGKIWQVLIRWEWTTELCIPYNSDGKFRVGKCELIKELESI